MMTVMMMVVVVVMMVVTMVKSILLSSVFYLFCRKQEQLAKLMAILHHTHPSFVRCLIPNEQKQPGEQLGLPSCSEFSKQQEFPVPIKRKREHNVNVVNKNITAVWYMCTYNVA